MVQPHFKFGGIIAGIGLGVLVVGCILIPVFDVLAYDTVVKSVRLVEGTQAYDNYLLPASPVMIQFWFFNLTNAEDVVNNGSTPRVEQVGPYSYSIVRPKEEVESWNGDTELRYQINSTYNFLPEESPGVDPYTDVIVNVNFVVLSIAKLAENMPPLLKLAVKLAIQWNKDKIFEPRTVDEYLWGYKDETASSILFIPDTYGLYYGLNGTLSDEFVVNTGIDDVDLVNEVISWRGNDTITTSEMTGEKPMWSTEKCNRIDGTDGTQYKPFVSRDDTLLTFSGQVCRSFDTVYDSDVTVKGIDLYRFILDPKSFAHHAVNPDNEGYCTPDLDHCLSPGFLNLSNCFDGVPIVGSMAHFYNGEHLLDTIIGLNPNKEEHQTTIDIQPTTGLTLQGHKRLQINIYIEPWSLFPDTNAEIFHDGFIFPIFWINESAIIPDEDAEEFIKDVIEPLELLEIIQYIIIGFGALLLVLALVVFLVMRMIIPQDQSQGREALEKDKSVKGGSFKKSFDTIYVNDVKLQKGQEKFNG